MEGQDQNWSQPSGQPESAASPGNNHSMPHNQNHILTQQQHQYPVYTPPMQQPLQAEQQHTGPAALLRRPCLLVAKAITWLPVCFIMAVVGWSYYAFVVQLNLFIVESLAEKVPFILFYHIILVLFIWSYWQTISAPTCSAPPKWTLSSAMLERLATAKSEEDWKHLLELFVVEMELTVVQRSKQGAIRYCDKCQAIKPDRSHHCSVCGKCILKMDHHCPWVNNCVAFNNYKFFILFLGYALTYCVYLAGCTFKYFILFWKGDLESHGAGKFHILFLFFVSIMFCISVSSLFWYHVYLIMYNKSTLEQFRAPYFNGAAGPDPLGWSLGKANNFMEVFGYNRWLWFLPVRTSVGDGLSFPTRIHYQSRSYQSMSEIGLAGSASGGGGVDGSNDVAINMMSAEQDLENGSAGNHPAGNGTVALLAGQETVSSPTATQPMQMTSVLDSNNRVTTRIGRPDSSYSMQ